VFSALDQVPQAELGKRPDTPPRRDQAFDTTALAVPDSVGETLLSSSRLFDTLEQPHKRAPAIDPNIVSTSLEPAPDLPLEPAPGRTTEGTPPRRQTGGRPGTTEAAGGSRHLVQPGEDFETIARSYYGAPKYGKALWWANRSKVAWPSALRAGTTIIVPPARQLHRELVVSRAPPDLPAARASSSRPTAPAAFPLSTPEIAAASGRAAAAPADTGLQRTGLRRDPARDSAPAADPVRAAAGPSGATANPGADGGYAVHVVQPRETLASIAMARLGDSRRALEIAELNRELLGPDRRIRPRQRLILPADARPLLPAP
jgi:nucleoid-associated protein YgaU